MGHRDLRANVLTQSRATCCMLFEFSQPWFQWNIEDLLTCFAEPCAGGRS